MRCLIALLVVSCFAVDAQAQLFRRWRSSGSCATANCQTMVVKHTAIQKDESPVQKEDAVQKEEGPVQKEDAIQKDGPTQKSVSVTSAVVVTQGSPLYQLALRKARIQASRGGRSFHVGGGFGGCRAEGVGSGATAAAALANCCFTGVRRCAAAAVVRGSNGRFYACKLFN